MKNIYITSRETEEYALNQPVLIKVDISTGKILIDNRSKLYSIREDIDNEKESKRIRK